MRLFLALIPSEDSLDRLEQWQTGFKDESREGQPVKRDKLHMTLSFAGHGTIGDLTRLSLEGDRIHQALGGKVSLVAPELSFDSRSIRGLGLVTFSRNLPLWDSISDIVEGDPSGRSFWPHITLFRKFRPDKPGFRPIRDCPLFSFSRLSLIESRLSPEGSRYSLLGEWAFASGHAVG